MTAFIFFSVCSLVYSYVRDIVVCAVLAQVYWQLVDGWTAERVVLT